MKEKKVNMKSIRFTDTIKDIIESQKGKGFNEKFENLILHCINELPEIENKIKTYNTKIEAQKREIKNMDILIEKLIKINRYVGYAINEIKN